MQYQHKEERIYSRTRLDLLGNLNKRKQGKTKRRRAFNFGFPYFNENKGKFKKVAHFLIICVVAFSTFFLIWNYIDPIFEKLCEDKAKSIATVITNEETSKIMEKYEYNTFFNVEKDEKGNVRMITSNVLKVNKVTSAISVNIQKSLESNEINQIFISLGSITGIKFLSGTGPRIPLKISSTGNIDTDVRSEFISKGVNQTIHRVYLDIKTNINILTSFKTIEKTIENQVLILENVIVGEIPETYYNFEGTNIEDEALRIIK